MQDVAKKLGAKLLYPVEDEEVAMSTEVTQYIVATLQLADLLRYLPRHIDPTKGSVVITSASRVDILLGLIHLHESKSDANIATVVLSGGNPPPKEVHDLLKVELSLQKSSFFSLGMECAWIYRALDLHIIICCTDG